MKKQKRFLQRVLRCRISEERLQSAMQLFPGKTRKEVEDLLQEKLSRRMFGALVAMLVSFVAVVILVSSEQEEPLVIQRPQTGETETVYQLQVKGETGWTKFDFLVAATQYTEEQVAVLHAQTEKYLDGVVISENENFSEVRTGL